MYAHVPHAVKIESRSNLPWINDECRAAVSAKHAAQGTDSYTEVSDNCTTVLQRVRAQYFYQFQVSTQRLTRNSKRW